MDHAGIPRKNTTAAVTRKMNPANILTTVSILLTGGATQSTLHETTGG